jgi:hypothetical protein
MCPSSIKIILEFLRQIGLTVIERAVPPGSVLPGISIDHGALVVDRAALLYPGDLLHEAGHLAVVPPAEREAFHHNVGDDGGMEMGAIAWSYAAAVHLGVPLDVLFHDHGYRGDGGWLREHFSTQASLGVPILTWRGLTDAASFPLMRQWLTAAAW